MMTWQKWMHDVNEMNGTSEWLSGRKNEGINEMDEMIHDMNEWNKWVNEYNQRNQWNDWNKWNVRQYFWWNCQWRQIYKSKNYLLKPIRTL